MIPSTTLGHYEILSPLGAGEVYSGRDPGIGREAAIIGGGSPTTPTGGGHAQRR